MGTNWDKRFFHKIFGCVCGTWQWNSGKRQLCSNTRTLNTKCVIRFKLARETAVTLSESLISFLLALYSNQLNRIRVRSTDSVTSAHCIRLSWMTVTAKKKKTKSQHTFLNIRHKFTSVNISFDHSIKCQYDPMRFIQFLLMSIKAILSWLTSIFFK